MPVMNIYAPLCARFNGKFWQIVEKSHIKEENPGFFKKKPRIFGGKTEKIFI